MNYKERPLSPKQVKPRGILAQRLRHSLDRLIRERAMHTAYAGWGADQIGRWIGATVLESCLLTDTSVPSIIQEKVDELCMAQDENGLFYGAGLRNNPERFRECWFGHGRGIWNLLEYCEITGDETAFASLLTAADHAVATRDTWQIAKPLCGGIESSVGPMAHLGQITHRQEYIEYARYMADNIQHNIAQPSQFPTAHVDSTNLHTHEEKPFFHHTHSYLNTTHGVVDLAVVTGEAKYVDQAKKAFADSFSSVWINGGFPESYGDYYERIDETCSVVDWIVLGLKLFDLTGEARYLDSVELSAVNQLLFGQDSNGTFTCYRSLNRHHWADPRNRGCPQNECCAMSGGWGLAQVAMHTITKNANGLSVNLPFDVRTVIERDGGEIHVEQSVLTGCSEVVQNIEVDNRTHHGIEVSIRVPYWVQEPQLRVKGSHCEVHPQHGFVRIMCPKNSTYSIELRLPMSLQTIPAGCNALTRDKETSASSAKEQGIQYGPYVLMLNRVMYPEIVQRDISVTVHLNSEGHPIVHQKCPAEWRVHTGAVPLFLEATVQDGSPVLLTPCANLTMTALTVDDPYILRFANINTSPLLKRSPNEN